MRKNLTHTAVESLKPHPDRQLDVWDAKRPGFGIRISPAGTKTWILMYRASGRKHRYVLGRFPAMGAAAARTAADAYRGDVARGENPAEERAQAKTDPTFGEFADIYLERHAMVHKRARSIVEDRKMLKGLDLKPWTHRKIADIKKRDVIAVIDKIVGRGAPVQANRVRSVLSRLFNFAAERDVIEATPMVGMSKRETEVARERKLSDDELRRLWVALDTQPKKIAGAFKLALLTAMRRSEVLGLSWNEINSEHACINLPGERTKNGEPHNIPLTSTAVALLAGLSRAPEAAYVFPGGRRGIPLANIKKPLEKIRDDAKLEDFHFHDLRRTVATRLAELGTDRITLKKLLNHSDRGDVTAVYDRHSYDKEKRAALLKWDRRLAAIISAAPAAPKVVNLRA